MFITSIVFCPRHKDSDEFIVNLIQEESIRLSVQ